LAAGDCAKKAIISCLSRRKSLSEAFSLFRCGSREQQVLWMELKKGGRERKEGFFGF
jgi:hypothetical protein